MYQLNYCFLLFYFFFFFFQAEDGIRDHCVTGVQTCALPIYLVVEVLRRRLDRRVAVGPHVHVAADLDVPDFAELPRLDRSEERRVGKECRSRWSAYH